MQLAEVQKRCSEVTLWFIDVRLELKAREHPGAGNSHVLVPRPPASPFSQLLGFGDLTIPLPPPPRPRSKNPHYVLVKAGAFSDLQIEPFLPSKPA